MTSTVAPFGLAVKRKIVQSCLISSICAPGPRRHSTGYDAASSHRGSHAICAPRRTPGARSRIHRIESAGRRSGRRPMSSINFRDDAMEWLEADGLGGFASGTASGKRTRRYHALLLAAATPPTGRCVLGSGLDATVTTPAGRFPISSQLYEPGVVHPDGVRRLEAFEPDPWPRWRFRLEDGTVIEQEIFVRRGVPVTVLSWRLAAGPPGTTLEVRPFLAGRDYHALHHENPAFNFEAGAARRRTQRRPSPGGPRTPPPRHGPPRTAPAWLPPAC